MLFYLKFCNQYAEYLIINRHDDVIIEEMDCRYILDESRRAGYITSAELISES